MSVCISVCDRFVCVTDYRVCDRLVCVVDRVCDRLEGVIVCVLVCVIARVCDRLVCVID